MPESTNSSTRSGVEPSEKSSVLSTVPPASELLLRAVRRVGFWMAVTLPFLVVPLLFSGIDSAAERQAFLVLLTLNVVALLVGHTYNE